MDDVTLWCHETAPLDLKTAFVFLNGRRPDSHALSFDVDLDSILSVQLSLAPIVLIYKCYAGTK